MLIQLPAGCRLCYILPRFVLNRFGNSGIGYTAPAWAEGLPLRLDGDEKSFFQKT